MPTVLVVDDEPDILEILQLTLEHAGYRVITAVDGAEALLAVRRETPDAMLLDVGLPHVDGWGVLEQIKASSDELAQVPVVMVTAWNSEEDRLRGGIEGALRYIGKPFDPQEVVRVVDGILAPGSPPEPVLRREVQQRTLERLARLERGDSEAAEMASDARVHLTRLDRPREPVHAPPTTEERLEAALDTLSSKQREVVDLLLAGEAVRAVAERLGVSRSNVYAILRRVGRKAGVPDGRELLRHLRALARARGGGEPRPG